MKMFCIKSQVFLVLLIFIAFCGLAQGADAPEPGNTPMIVGTWKLNLAKSKFTTGPPFQSRILIWEWAGDTLTHTNHTVNSKREKSTARFSAKFDGKDYPVYEPEDVKKPARYVRMKWIDAYTVESVNRKDGKDLTTYRHTVSKDGKTDTITQTGTTPEGQHGKDVLVYDKQ